MNEQAHTFDPATATPLDEVLAAHQRANRATRARKRGFLLLGGALALGLVAYGGYEALFAGSTEATDDAYVAGDVVAITAREPGNVVAIHADNTESVKQGAALVDFDTDTADAQLAQAAANLALAVRNVRSDFSRVAETSAEVVQAQAELARAHNDLTRRQGAEAEGAVSGEEVSHAADSLRTAQAALAVAQSRHGEAQSAVGGAALESNPNVLAAIAAYRRAAIVVGHMHLAAPVDGIVAQRSVQLGQHVEAGTPLMAVVPLKAVWVDANFRETQLADLRVGQPVTVRSDAYGSDVTFHGKVLGLGAGSGNAFALLPPQNASGNWIKIVQRLPVRIALDPRELGHNPLRIGLSVKVSVDTTDHSGTPVARSATGQFQHEERLDDTATVDRQIAAIIAANRGGGAGQ